MKKKVRVPSDKLPKYLGLMILALMIGVFFIVGIGVFMLYYDYPVTEFNNDPFPVVNDVIKQGEELQYRVDYCRPNDAKVVVIREMVDGVVFTFPSIESRFEKGCHNVTVASLEIPHYIPEGTYTLRLILYYEVNPLRTIVKEVSTQPFTVVSEK